VHHGIWDFDIPCAPILADITVNGRAIKALAQPTKQSWLYVFDRVTGQPVWPIEERPVQKGDVPGEWYSPTQPHPTKPPAYERQGVTTDDLIDFTPELHAEAVALVSKYKIGPIFTPPVVSKVDGPLATLMQAFATNWEGGSYDPETHKLYVFSSGGILALGLVPPADKRDFDYVQGLATTGMRTSGGSGSNVPSATGRSEPPPPPVPGGSATAAGEVGGGGLNVRGLPLAKPPYGRITAIDMDKGEIAWQTAHGETADNLRNHPTLKGLNIPRTGRAGQIGTLVTKTLVIAGDAGVATQPSGARGAMLRAYDKATGREVGSVFMPATQTGGPMSYMWNGRQYIVVAISGGSYSGEFVAFRLPAEAATSARP
jgi:quinoprotein glucose dehydrogenase